MAVQVAIAKRSAVPAVAVAESADGRAVPARRFGSNSESRFRALAGLLAGSGCADLRFAGCPGCGALTSACGLSLPASAVRIARGPAFSPAPFSACPGAVAARTGTRRSRGTSRSPFSVRLTAGNCDRRRRFSQRIVARIADRAGDIERARIEARKRISRRDRDHRAERLRKTECRGLHRAERRDAHILPPAVGHRRLARDQRGQVLKTDGRRHHRQQEDDQAEGAALAALRPVTRGTHPHTHATPQTQHTHTSRGGTPRLR